MIFAHLEKQLHSANGAMNLQLRFDVLAGQFLCLYGESGVGKTSILRMLAGLMTPEGGKIVVGGETWYDSKLGINLSPQKRKIGFVFQEFGLFPNMTVRENIQFALQKGQEEKMVQELMNLMEIEALQNKKPDSLSGGQKQRVALARALAPKPRILLLDEPLSALDSRIRAKLQQFIQKIHKEFSLTTIMVSHDEKEVAFLADRVLVVGDGAIVKDGAAVEVFGKTIGKSVSLEGEIVKIEPHGEKWLVSVLIQR